MSKCFHDVNPNLILLPHPTNVETIATKTFAINRLGHIILQPSYCQWKRNTYWPTDTPVNLRPFPIPFFHSPIYSDRYRVTDLGEILCVINWNVKKKQRILKTRLKSYFLLCIIFHYVIGELINTKFAPIIECFSPKLFPFIK